jgi:hypothetical protein
MVMSRAPTVEWLQTLFGARNVSYGGVQTCGCRRNIYIRMQF